MSISIRFKCTLFNYCCFFPIANLLTVSVAAGSFIGMLCMHWCFSFSSLFFNLLLMGFVELYLYWILSMIFVFSFLSLLFNLYMAKFSLRKMVIIWQFIRCWFSLLRVFQFNGCPEFLLVIKCDKHTFFVLI